MRIWSRWTDLVESFPTHIFGQFLELRLNYSDFLKSLWKFSLHFSTTAPTAVDQPDYVAVDQLDDMEFDRSDDVAVDRSEDVTVDLPMMWTMTWQHLIAPLGRL